MKDMSRIQIRPDARNWPLEQTPITTRLRNALLKLELCVLGDIHGMEFNDIKRIRACGVGSVRDLRKFVAELNAGAFDQPGAVNAREAMVRIIAIIDQFCRRLPARDRDVVLTRLGGHKKPRTLARIGRKYELTRERVRQVVNLRMTELSRHCGPSLLKLVQTVTKHCMDHVCPITPALLEEWCGAGNTGQYLPAFYVRVLHGFSPDCPAWADQRGTGAPSLEEKRIVNEVAEILRGMTAPQSSREVFLQLRCRKEFAATRVSAFLSALYRGHEIGFQFVDSTHLQVLPPAPDPVECVLQVLRKSDHPLGLHEIVYRARLTHGEGALKIPGYRLAQILRTAAEIILLDEDVFGLRKHIRLPESEWATVQDDIQEDLELVGWTISSFDVIQRRRFAWASLINAYELSVILRSDPRFAETERGSFMLSVPAAARPSLTPVLQLQS